MTPISRCRFCRSGSGEVVLDLGRQPSSELFPPPGDAAADRRYPLRMWLCAECGLAQLADDADVPEEPLGDEPSALTAQRRDAVARLVTEHVLPGSGTVAEFPSPHGGSWLGLLAGHGLNPAGPGAAAADVVVDGSFGLMHDPNQLAALELRIGRLRPGGVLILQYHSLEAIVRGAQWNALRLGHFAYYSTPALVGMLARLRLRAGTAHRFPLYGGTVLLAASRTRVVDEEALAAVVGPEHEAGVLRPEVVRGLQDEVGRTTAALREMLVEHRAAGRRVYGYGAASRAVSLMSLAGLDSTLLAAVADASPAKQGRRMPGTDIPVIAPDELVAAAPDVVLVFVSDLVDEVRAALPQIERHGGSWVDAGSGAAGLLASVPAGPGAAGCP